MDMLHPPSLLEPLLILIGWTAVLGVIALLFLALVRAAGRLADEEVNELRVALGQAQEIQAAYDAREKQHLAEISRLRRRLQNLQDMDNAA